MKISKKWEENAEYREKEGKKGCFNIRCGKKTMLIPQQEMSAFG